jgi:NADP-dependent 3-hydroxy acid dehydrogenase YdfG
MSDPEPRLTGRRFLVTGASSGIGRAIAVALAEAGARVACAARRLDVIETLAADIGAIAVECDVTDPGVARAAVDAAADAFGGLDGVVNNAGIMLLGTVADGPVEGWKAMFDANVLGVLYVTHAAIPHLRMSGGGDIVNVSSIAGRRVAGPERGVYAATKHAVHALSEGLRQELHSDGIRVLVVSPGIVRTALGRGMPDSAHEARFRKAQDEFGLDPCVVAGRVVDAVALPRDAMVHEICLMPTVQP